MDNKIIEEMARDLGELACLNKCTACKHYYNKYEVSCVDMNFAEKLFEQGYRKTPENAVVLTREEYYEREKKIHEQAQIESVEIYKDMLKVERAKARKETAEKIIDLIKTFCPDKKFVEAITRIIAERLGVEIKG